jgi:hypothetical protein
MPTQDDIGSEHEPRKPQDNAAKPTSSVATPPKEVIFNMSASRCLWTRSWKTVAERPDTVATPQQDAIFGTIEHRNAVGHDVEESTPSVATPKDAIFIVCALGTPLDVSLKPTQASRRQSSWRRRKTPYLEQVTLGMALDTKLGNRHRASRRPTSQRRL